MIINWVMKKLLLVLVFTAMGMFEGHSQALVQTYVDRCTGQVSVFTVPMNGQTVVAFYNRSRTFTSQDFQNGTLQSWLEETYLWWTSLSPCSTNITGATNTTQQTQQTTQQATEAAQNASQAATQQVPDVPTTPTAPPPVQETPTAPDTSATTTSPDTSSAPDTQGTGSNANTGTDQTATGGSETGTSDTQTDSQQTDSSSGSESTSSEETTSTESSESTESTESSESQESTDDSSTEGDTEETTNDEGDSNDGEASEEETESEDVEEESSEEETTEEETEEEETTEEESEEEETEEEESEEEESEEESDDEEEEEEEEEEKKALPIVLSSNVITQQLPTGEYITAAQVGFTQSSLLGDKTYGGSLMAWSNGQQFMLNLNYSKVHINKEGRVDRVYSAGLSGAKMFTTYMASMNHSMVFLGKRGSASGIALGTSLTSVELDVRGGLVYYDDLTISTSLTGFYTKPISYSPKLTLTPMIAVSAPFANASLYSINEVKINKDLIFIGGTTINYKLTKRFGINIGVTAIEATIKDFPTLLNFNIGGKVSF